MAPGADKNSGSSRKTSSKRGSKASKIKSAEIVKDSDEEESEGTSHKTSRGRDEGVKLASSGKPQASMPIDSKKSRHETVNLQDLPRSPKLKASVPNARLPKEQKLDSSNSFDKSKTSLHTEPSLALDKQSKRGDISSPPKSKPLVVNGEPPKKQEPDNSDSSGSDSQEIYSQSDGDESSNESQSSRSSSIGRSDGNQSETSSSIGRSNEPRAHPGSKNSALASQPTIPLKPAPPYEPPVGFKSTPITLHPASEIAQLLSTSALQGKELWHITVPKSVPVSLITEVSAKSVMTGAAILSHDGAEYNLIPETQDKTAQRIVLLPSSKTANYESAQMNITKTLHLRRIVRLPKSAARSGEPTEGTSRNHIKRMNEQPPGLKMRYRPFGASSESSEKSDSELIETESLPATQFQVPRNAVASSSTKRKRDHIDYTDETQSLARAKKKKKEKKKPLSSDELIESEQIQEQHISQNQAPDESPEVPTPAELRIDPHHSTITSENESTKTPRHNPLKKAKRHHRHHHKEPNSPPPLSNKNTPTKIAASPPPPLPIPNAHPPTIEPQTPSIPPPTKTTSPSPQIPTSQDPKKPQHPAPHPDETHPPAEKEDAHTPRPSKRNKHETQEERAKRKAEEKRLETPEDRKGRLLELRKRKEERRRKRAEGAGVGE